MIYNINKVYGIKNENDYIIKFVIENNENNLTENHVYFRDQDSNYLGNLEIYEDGFFKYKADNDIIVETTEQEKNDDKAIKLKNKIVSGIKSTSKTYRERGFSFDGRIFPAKKYDLIYYQNLYTEYSVKEKLKKNVAYKDKSGLFFEISDKNVEQLCDAATQHVIATVYSNDELLDEVENMTLEELENFQDIRLEDPSEVIRLVQERTARLS